MALICTLLSLYLLVLLVRIVLSWFPGVTEGGLGAVYGFLHTITEPVLAPVRRVLPPVQFGGAGIDLSPMLVLLVGSLLRGALCA